MKKTNYDSLPIEDLEAHLQELGQQKQRLHEEMRQITTALDAKRAQESVDAKLAGLSPAEREALLQRAQSVGVEGIASAEAVGPTA